MTGQHGNPHFGVLHILSLVFIFAGFTLLSKAWHVLYHAQRRRQVATTGPYRYVRHPQYIGFVAIMFGFLLQWPTLLTLAMFPVLVVMYVRLAIAEERDSEQAFGQAWRAYAANDAPLHSVVEAGTVGCRRRRQAPLAIRSHGLDRSRQRVGAAQLAKGAELASGLGAIVLGAGLALVLPDWLRAYAMPLLVGGVVVHGLGMTLKYRSRLATVRRCGGSGPCSGYAGPAWSGLGIWIAAVAFGS